MAETMKLQDLIDEVVSKKLVLPDFQRKFVWTQDNMRSLYSSVLCKMPFGSILTLESKDKEFSCKKFGAKSRVCKEDIPSGVETKYLIDGQQRLTSLFAGFSTYYFTAFKDDSKNIAANRLLDLYFLKIPAETNKENALDLFNAKKQDFDSNWKNQGSSYFSSTEVKDLIESKKVSEIIKDSKNTFFDIESKTDLEEVIKYCCNNNGDFYRIPLQFILCNTGNASTVLNKIIRKISVSFLDNDNQENEDLRDTWVDNVKTYLKTCLSELELNQIEVKNSDKSRAIDIYSNLNKGGVALNVFDLIMARVGGVSSENFYETLVKYIQETYTYPDSLKNDVILNIKPPKNYIATETAEVLSDKEDISAEYINNFLNILALYIAKQDGANLTPDVIKQDKILDLDPQKIYNYSSLICKAMDRALFFFQTRCGIRKLSDINYKAEFAVIAFFFTEDKYFNDIRIHNFFEYWYWISIFAYMYPSNQDVKILGEIPAFQKYFESDLQDKSIFNKLEAEYKKQVLNVRHYSDKETLVMANAKSSEIAPSAQMQKYVCQFYMSKGYKDFLNSDIEINFLYSDPLDVHHLMPLGSSPDKKIGTTTKELRKDKFNQFNSPLNMLYITKASNKTISSMDYHKYSSDANIANVLNLLGCQTGSNVTNLTDFLNDRYNKFSAEVINRLDKLYSTL